MAKYREPTETELAQVSSELQKVAYASQWDRILTVGSLIFRCFFHGDEDAWRERRRNKDLSIRKLAEREDCPFRKSALTEAVGIHVFCAKYPEARSSKHITPTHVGKTLGLAPQVAVELLARAGREKWSVRQVASEATSMRRQLGERRGRPNSPFDKKAERCGKRAVALLVEMRECLVQSTPADAQSREHFKAICQLVEDSLAGVWGTLSRTKTGSWRIPTLVANPHASPARRHAEMRSSAG